MQIESSHITTIPRVARALLILLSISIVIGYALFQSRNLLEGPVITLSVEPETIQHTRTLVLEGETRNITGLTLNGRSVHTDASGNFKHTLVLENGYTIMTLSAKDRYGRTTSLSRPFIYSEENNTSS